jgi:glycine cleavage system transcriptional repressor
MKRIAWTFIGKDRPGIIAGVTAALYQGGCNIEDTTMTILEGEFAMILIASMPNPAAERNLVKRFDRLKARWGLNHFRKSLPVDLVRGEKHPPHTKTYIVSVAGRDRTGIVYETTRILARARLNITDLNSKILGEGKQSVFAMILEVDVPQRFNIKRLEPAWRRLRTRLGVDVHIKPLERLSL